jgi:hypothetical protein
MEQVQFTSILTQFPNSPLWGWHFLVPEAIAKTFVNGKDRRVICTINDLITMHSALMPNKDAWFVMMNQGNVKKLNLRPNSEIQVVMAKDISEYGMPMADEFREVLDQEPLADQYFHALTPGKQRTLLHIINSVKNTESRIKKSLAIADHIVVNKGTINYKLLNEAFKEYNKM